MSQLDERTVQINGNDKPTDTESSNGSPSYFESNDTLRSRIDELTTVASRGNPAEVAAALTELDGIERRLKNSEAEDPVGNEDVKEPSSGGDKPVVDDHSPAIDKGESKKFRIQWQGKSIEYDDADNLLGHENTGRLKSSFLKEKLSREEAQKRADETARQNSDLVARLRTAEEQLKTYQSPRKTASPAAPISPVSRQRLMQPVYPKLSTDDPSVYTTEDILALKKYNEDTAAFYGKVVESLDRVETSPREVTDTALRDEIKDLKGQMQTVLSTVERARQDDAERAANDRQWKMFTDFQGQHDTFKTDTPIEKLNSLMAVWMDRVASANGVKPPINGKDDLAWNEYVRQRAEVIDRFVGNDPDVVKNADGLVPPKEHDKYLKILALYNAYCNYKEDGVFGEKATLDDAYLRQMRDSGDFTDSINKIRFDERTNAVTEFSNKIDNLQKEAPGIDPSLSGSGPDLNQFGISVDDMRWFQGVNPMKLHAMQTKDPTGYKKWFDIAERIRKIAV